MDLIIANLNLNLYDRYTEIQKTGLYSPENTAWLKLIGKTVIFENGINLFLQLDIVPIFAAIQG